MWKISKLGLNLGTKAWQTQASAHPKLGSISLLHFYHYFDNTDTFHTGVKRTVLWHLLESIIFFPLIKVLHRDTKQKHRFWILLIWSTQGELKKNNYYKCAAIIEGCTFHSINLKQVWQTSSYLAAPKGISHLFFYFYNRS